MRTAILTSRLSGVAVKCHATTEHPDSHHGCPVWVDNLGRAYCEVDKPSEYYEVDEDVDGNPRVVIGQRIAELRKEQGMSQAELADKCGMQRPHIARVESGRYGITLDVLARIANALGRTVDLV
jgi:DNA-binding XRE family transcriptional regulator